jgi:transposase
MKTMMLLAEFLPTYQQKYQQLFPTLNERTKRMVAASDVEQLGRGGFTLIKEASGLDFKTLRRGLAELKINAKERLAPNRVRLPGGGRKQLTQSDPQIINSIETLIEPETRGDPENPLRWTTKSTRRIASTLREFGHSIQHHSVAKLLKRLGYSLQSPRKQQEGRQHPDRDSQFQYISTWIYSQITKKNPCISIDTKKKELVGNFKNNGKTWRPTKTPIEVNVHDFPSDARGKAIPYGVYDVRDNNGYVSIGMDHDTASFAVNSIRTWWQHLGEKRYPDSTELTITADSGGSNSSRSRLFKKELQDFANETGLGIHVLHFPPGTSKWNKIEHKLFSFIGINWKGIPLTSYEVIISLIASTTNKNGLKVYVALDENSYPIGVKVSDGVMNAINLIRHDWHGDWNYTIKPHENLQTIVV